MNCQLEQNLTLNHLESEKLANYVKSAEKILEEMRKQKKKEKKIWLQYLDNLKALKNLKRKIRRNIIYMYFPEEKDRRDVLAMNGSLFLKTLTKEKFVFCLLTNDLTNIEKFTLKIYHKIRASEKYVKFHEVWTPWKIIYIIYELLKIKQELQKQESAMNEENSLDHSEEDKSLEEVEFAEENLSLSNQSQKYFPISNFFANSQIEQISESNTVFYSKKYCQTGKGQQ